MRRRSNPALEVRSGIFILPKKAILLRQIRTFGLWEKTHIGDKFYLISFQDSQEIKKVYPQNILKYVNK